MGQAPTLTRLQGLPLVLATLAISLPYFMSVLDTTIIVVSLPSIAGALGATHSQGTWILTSYAVCLAVVLPLAGWLSQRYGELQVFVFSILGFTVTSALCGLADNFSLLVLLRALQGFTGGLLVPLSQSLMLRIYPADKQGLALGIWSLSAAAAPVVGPILGGVLTDNWGWPWIFYINVPFGLLSLFLLYNYRSSLPKSYRKTPVDYIGLLLLVGGVVCLQLALDRGQELDWLASRQIQLLFLSAIIGLVFFVVWERDEKYPVVDLSLFRNHAFVLGSVLIAGVYIVFMISGMIYPIWLQTAMGYTATWSGLVLAPTLLTPFVLMPLVGKYLHLADLRLFVWFGAALMSFGMYLHGSAWVGLDVQSIAWARVVIGTSMPFLWVPLVSATLAGVTADKMAMATGLYNFIRMLGASLGMGLSVTLWDQRSIYHHSQLVDSVSRGELPGGVVIESSASLSLLEMEIQRQASTLALNDVFFAAIVLLALVALGSLGLPGRLGNR
jgi:DHA2 family multidrug resistance protein